MTRAEVYSKCVERIYGNYEEDSYFAKHILPKEAIDAIIDCAVEEAVIRIKEEEEKCVTQRIR